jgi:hypothetical protein
MVCSPCHAKTSQAQNAAAHVTCDAVDWSHYADGSYQMPLCDHWQLRVAYRWEVRRATRSLLRQALLVKVLLVQIVMM